MTKRSKLYSDARLDHRVICDIVKANTRILDLGCGEGDLMLLLAKEKNARVQGIELKENAIYKCVAKGLNVFHGNIDQGLIEYPDSSFDYVILNQSMQEVKKSGYLIGEALRVGKNVIIGFPNFAYIQARLRLCLQGKVPITTSLPYTWYDTPNLHFLTIFDFKDFCCSKDVRILNEVYIGAKGIVRLWPNLFAINAIFVIQK